MSEDNDEKRGQGAGESPLGGFGTGARAKGGAEPTVQGTITGRWDGSVVKSDQPPSVRGMAYVNRQTARKLLQGMAKEFRAQAAVSVENGFDGDADNFNRWAEQCESALGLTLGGG